MTSLTPVILSELKWIQNKTMPTIDDLNFFTSKCLEHNELIGLDPGLLHNAHHPTPKCFGGTETVKLTTSQHAAHGVIQSCVMNHPCIWSWEQVFIEHDWPELLDLFHEWMTIKNKKAGSKGGQALSFEQYSNAGKIGGSIAGKKNVESGHWKECQTAGTKESFRYKYACLITGYCGYPMHVSCHQNKLGIDTKMRIRLVPQVLKEQKIA
jgi:hypothetical protein